MLKAGADVMDQTAGTAQKPGQDDCTPCPSEFQDRRSRKMKKVFDPLFTTEEFIRIYDNDQTGVFAWGSADPKELYKAYAEKHLAPYRHDLRLYLRLVESFVFDYMFECGRMFGIRQERMRRRGGK